MLGRIGILELIIFPIIFIIPTIILYFVVKLAVKQAIIELKDNDII